jgi:hypothetical protein
VFDGLSVRPAGFIEQPVILADESYEGTVGALTALASHTYQVVWEALSGTGQVVRSVASPPVTLTSTGANDQWLVVATFPQLSGRYLEGAATVTARLYATEANPSAGAALYLVPEGTSTGTVTGGALTVPVVAMSHRIEVDTAGPQLYTGGDVLDDEPPPEADRGFAFVADRYWCAGARAVYASKLVRDERVAPAWNTAGLHTIDVPNSLGRVQGIAAVDNKLAVVCTGGVMVVYGDGVDDLGEGNGWATQVISLVGAGESTPRSIASSPEGALFLSAEGDVWGVTPSGVQCVSRPVRSHAAAALDVVWCR